MDSVLTMPGLRIHSCHRVASTSIIQTLRSTVKFGRESPDAAGDEYRWMVVRHPLGRLVSAWAFFCNQKEDVLKTQTKLLKMGYYHGMPFSEFLDLALIHHDEDPHTRQQIHFAGPHKIDRIVQLENLTEEWNLLCDRFPFISRDLIHNHKSDHEPEFTQEFCAYYPTPLDYNRAMTVFQADADLYHRDNA